MRTEIEHRQVGVVADSAANVPPALARELGIEIVPMYLRIGEETFRDGTDLPLDGFYRRLAARREPATTSTPSPGDFLTAFERTGRREVVCVSVASTMSASHQQAMLAAERFDGRAEVVDSLSASMAEGFVALGAARAAAEGAPLTDVARAARSIAAETWLFATVDTFEFLQLANLARGSKTIHSWHFDVHNDEVRTANFCFSHSLISVFRFDHAKALPEEE